MDWGNYFFLSDLGNRLDIDKAKKRIRRMRSQMLEKTGRDHHQDARLLALEQENDEIKLVIMDLLNTLMQREAITEQDTQEIIQRVAAASREVYEETEEDRLADLQAALDDEESAGTD